jgi:predicted transcriptional regulator
MGKEESHALDFPILALLEFAPASAKNITRQLIDTYNIILNLREICARIKILRKAGLVKRMDNFKNIYTITKEGLNELTDFNYVSVLALGPKVKAILGWDSQKPINGKS